MQTAGPSPVPNDNSSSNTNDNGSSDGDSATLTLRITGPSNGGFARVYGIVDDGPQDHASLENRVPQSDFNLSLGPAFGGMIERMFSYPKGTKIALVAVEGDGFLTSTPPPDQITTVPMQFSQFVGDIVTGDFGENPAVLYFTLDGDRTITAEFVAMDPIFITAEGGGPESNILINVEVDRYIVPPRPVDESGVNASDSPLPHVLWGYHRDGAVLKLQLRDYEDNDSAGCTNPMIGPCYVFVTWNGDCLGAGKMCELIFGQHSDAKVILQDRN